MKFPLKTWTLNQPFGNDPVVNYDTWYGPYLVKKGQHVYQVLANQIGHNGVDLGAPRNEPICAVSDGYLVERIGKETGYGLRISHRFTLWGMEILAVYGHMDHFADENEFGYDWNSKSHPIKAGEVIGYVDSTGASTGDHLHLSFYVMNKDGFKFLENNGFGGAVDPWPFLQGVNMVYFAHVKGTEEYGFVEVTPFEKIYHRGTGPEDIKFQAGKFGLKITNDNGSINYSSAKEIEI